MRHVRLPAPSRVRADVEFFRPTCFPGFLEPCGDRRPQVFEPVVHLRHSGPSSSQDSGRELGEGAIWQVHSPGIGHCPFPTRDGPGWSGRNTRPSLARDPGLRRGMRDPTGGGVADRSAYAAAASLHPVPDPMGTMPAAGASKFPSQKTQQTVRSHGTAPGAGSAGSGGGTTVPDRQSHRGSSGGPPEGVDAGLPQTGHVRIGAPRALRLAATRPRP